MDAEFEIQPQRCQRSTTVFDAGASGNAAGVGSMIANSTSGNSSGSRMREEYPTHGVAAAPNPHLFLC
jgi:hypothetical protein